VVLKVGLGPKAITVPHVRGLQYPEATTLLQNAGFTVNPPQFINSPAGPRNSVVGSTPKEGQSEPPGTAVTLRVASGSVVIPTSIRGMSCADATKALQNLTLKPSCQNRPSQAPPGGAVATYPTAIGGTITQDSPITIFISSGPAQTSLPNVVGQTSGDAKRALRDAGFKVKVTQEVECVDQSKDNIVQSQNPNGPTAPRGSFVSITVAKFRPNDPSCGGPPST
jgi:serine/threonine-protein kinase